MCILAYPVGRFYDHPDLFWILPAVGFNAVIFGFRSTAVATQSRDLVLGRQTAIDLVSQVATIVVMVGWAWFDRSVWALVVGGTVGALVSVVLSHMALPGIKHRMLWNRECAKELLGFGKWITFSTAFSFLAAQGDRAILSTFVSLSMVGIYSVATNITQVPGNVLAKLQSSILFPVYSRWGRGDRKELADKVYRVRIKTLAALPGSAVRDRGRRGAHHPPALRLALPRGGLDALADVHRPRAAHADHDDRSHLARGRRFVRPHVADHEQGVPSCSSRWWSAGT